MSNQRLPAGIACATKLAPLVPFLLLALPAAAQAQFTYRTNNGTITITRYNGPGGAVVIPDTIDGLPVTRIGDLAFSATSDVTSVTIPNSITALGNSVFYGAKLTSVTIPGSVTSFGNYVFRSCESLTNVTLLTGVPRIGDRAFHFCTSLTSVTIPSSVTSIGAYAFESCTSLTNFTIPDSVTSITLGVFYNCTNLISITIPNSVLSILDFAFAGCTRLTSISIPDSVTSIERSAFQDCTGLSTITVDALNPSYSSLDGVLFDKSQTLLFVCPGGKAGSYTIPNSVTSIGHVAFGNCSSLTSVTIPDGVTSIGNFAFEFCASLTNLTIPKSVASIGIAAFQYCTSMRAINVDAFNSSFSSVDGVLFNKSRTLVIKCPGGKVGSYAIPNGVTRIEGGAFDFCLNISSVTVPASVTSIGNYAFHSCTNLTGVYFQGNAPSFGQFEVIFDDSTNTTVYYLPGTMGWGPTYDLRPAVLWNPLVKTSDATFGVRTNRFGFTITGASNLVIVVVASPNLVNPAWIPVATNTLTGGSSYFSDPNWTDYRTRFYRLRSP